MDRRRFLGWGASALTAGLAGCGGGDGSLVPSRTDTSERNATGTTQTPAVAADVVVEMTDDLDFRPDSVEVAVGETVEWTNVGTYRHTVTAYGDGMFETAGTYEYYCIPHENAGMVGTVEVQSE